VIASTRYANAFSPHRTGDVAFWVSARNESTRVSTGLFGLIHLDQERSVFTVDFAAECNVRFMPSTGGFFGLMLGYGALTQDSAW
jgi:hypothetical protein